MFRTITKSFIGKLAPYSRRRYASQVPLIDFLNLQNKVGAVETTATETNKSLGLIVVQLAKQQAENNARFAELLARFAEQRAETAAQFAAMQADMNVGFKSVKTEIDTVNKIVNFTSAQVTNIQNNISNNFEFLCAAWLKGWMSDVNKTEVPYESFQLRRHFTDTQGIIDPAEKGRAVDVEIDILCEEPVLVAAELTWTLGSGKTSKSPEEAVKKARKFVKKLDFLKDKFGKPPLAFFVCSAGIDKDTHSALKEYLDENEIRLIYFNGKRIFSNKKSL